jgi:predicted TIM-barrel fold metal-dependent hydrolase
MEFINEIIGTRPDQISPLPAKVFQRLKALADHTGARLGMDRRRFLKTSLGMAAFFLAMNDVFGPFFEVSPAEALERGAGQDLSGQFIFDVQVHFIRDGYPYPQSLLSLRQAAVDADPRLKGKKAKPEDIMFEGFYQGVFQQSQTKMAVLSNAPADQKEGWFLTNDQVMEARKTVNERIGSRRLLGHALFTPGQPGWMEEMERVIALRPDAWKGYTLGDPRGQSRYPWRLDDEKLVYPAYEKMEKAGIRNICIHKGLLPAGYRKILSGTQITSAGIEDLGKAAKDWPNLNFIIYHSAVRTLFPTRQDLARFRKTGRIPWVTELSEIPARFGVSNVYGELGAVFAMTALTQPEMCAGILGTLIKGLGPDHVCWGTDSVWFGSPQWQIEALRRIEIPEVLQQRYGFKPLGPADGPVKRAILGENSARLYGITLPA